MRVRHPEVLEDVGGHCPAVVGIGGEDYDCADGSAFEVSEAQAEALADRYGVEVVSIRADDETAPDPADGGEDGSDDPSGTCEVIKGDGEVCGRERPCPYHD